MTHATWSSHLARLEDERLAPGERLTGADPPFGWFANGIRKQQEAIHLWGRPFQTYPAKPMPCSACLTWADRGPRRQQEVGLRRAGSGRAGPDLKGMQSEPLLTIRRSLLMTMLVLFCLAAFQELLPNEIPLWRAFRFASD